MARVVTDPGLIDDFEGSFYGEETEEGLRLEDVEEAYLVEQGRLNGSFEDVLSSGGGRFPVRFLVYRDLRTRGYYLKPGGEAADFLVYPRGEGPGEAPAEYLVHVVSERSEIPFGEARQWLVEASNLRREAVCSIVDEEGDITHYGLSDPVPGGEESEGAGSYEGVLLGDRVLARGKSLHEEEFYGQPLGDRVQLSLVEAHYLVERGRLELDVSPSELEERAVELEPDFHEKARLYRELRGNGAVPKTGFKFGSHFRTYSYFESLEDFPHAEYLVHAVRPDHSFEPPELSRAVRLAQSVRKGMVFASMGRDIEYLSFGRMRP